MQAPRYSSRFSCPPVLTCTPLASRQGICFFTSLTRTDSNAALALLGLYSSYGAIALSVPVPHPLARLTGQSSCTGRKKEAAKLYFVFLLLSIVTDFIWMIMYGNQIAGLFPPASPSPPPILAYNRTWPSVDDLLHVSGSCLEGGRR